MSATHTPPVTDEELRVRESEGVKRVAAISDGVFAIAMTLLVLDLHLPDADTIHSSADLRSALTLWSDYGAYALSFLVIALYWENHWSAFKRLLRIDRLALWLNMAVLLGIGFIPFPTSVLSDYGEYASSTAFYAGTLGAIGLVWAFFGCTRCKAECWRQTTKAAKRTGHTRHSSRRLYSSHPQSSLFGIPTPRSMSGS